MTGVYAGFVPEVVSLIRLLFYHYGDLKVDPAGVNQLLLNQIQCKSQVFTKPCNAGMRFGIGSTPTRAILNCAGWFHIDSKFNGTVATFPP